MTWHASPHPSRIRALPCLAPHGRDAGPRPSQPGASLHLRSGRHHAGAGGADGAFVGRLVLRQEIPPSPGEDAPDGIRDNAFLYRFRVDEIVKGSFRGEVNVRSGEGGGDCGDQPHSR